MNASPISSCLLLAAQARRLPWSAKLLSAVGEILITVTMVSFGLFAMFFCTVVMGLPRGLGAALFRAASAVHRIPYMSLGAGLALDYAERTTVIAMRALFGLLGALAAAGHGAEAHG